MNPEILTLRESLQSAKVRFYAGAGSYDEMKAAAQLLADAINVKGKEIARKYKKPFKPASALALMR